MKKIPKINKRKDMLQGLRYYRCKECGFEQSEKEYFS